MPKRIAYSSMEIGQKYGRWTVIDSAPRDHRGARQFYCRCNCGTEKPVLAFNLINGKSTKCVQCTSSSIHDVLEKLIICEPSRLQSGCWEWRGNQLRGYGRVKFQGKTWSVHRLVYEHFCGNIPTGKHLDHLCENPCCANFEHLEPVTPRENTLRGNTPAARNLAKTHCPKGHAYAGDNLYVSRRGDRMCKMCLKMAHERNKERKRDRSV